MCSTSFMPRLPRSCIPETYRNRGEKASEDPDTGVERQETRFTPRLTKHDHEIPGRARNKVKIYSSPVTQEVDSNLYVPAEPTAPPPPRPPHHSRHTRGSFVRRRYIRMERDKTPRESLRVPSRGDVRRGTTFVANES